MGLPKGNPIINCLYGDDFILRSDDFKADTEGLFVFVPIGAQHLEATYLSGGANMFANARTDIIVANANQTDGTGYIVRKTVERDFIGQLAELAELEGNGQVFVDKTLHLTLYLLLLLTGGLAVEIETHLALLALDVCIIGTLASEEAYHGLVEQMLCRMGRGEFILVMLV